MVAGKFFVLFDNQKEGIQVEHIDHSNPEAGRRIAIDPNHRSDQEVCSWGSDKRPDLPAWQRSL